MTTQQSKIYEYCIIGAHLYRFTNKNQNGEFWFEPDKTWFPSVPPSIGEYANHISNKVIFLNLFQAIEQFPEAFQ